MDDFKSNKLLTVIGSVLLLIPGVNIVGLLLILMGMKGLSVHYKDIRIYRNALIGVIIAIIGFIAINISMLPLFIRIFFPLPSGSSGSLVTTAVSYVPNVLLMFVAFIFISLMALFFRKAFRALSACSGLRLFRVVGNLLFIGAIVPVLCISLAVILAVILRINPITYDTEVLLMNTGVLSAVLGLFVGLLLVYIAFVLLVVAFFSLKPAYLTASTLTVETKSCTYCGTPLSSENAFCSHCGKQHKPE
jgi:uncharacterized membrane protein